MRGEDGQGTLDYVAVVLLVALVLSAAIAVLAGTGLGAKVTEAMRRALCVVTGSACGPAERFAGPCVLASDERSESGRLNIMAVGSGDSELALTEQRSDGTVALTIVRGDAVGIDLGSGAEGHVRWGGFSHAVGGALRAAVMAERGSGRTWIARDAAEAARLFDRIRVATALPGGAERLAIPSPDVTFSERGSGLSLALRAGAGDRVVNASIDDAYGERLDRRTGQRTVYVRDRLEGEATVSFGALSAAGVAAGEERIGITFDRRGRPVDLVVLATLDVEGLADLPAGLTRSAGPLGIPRRGQRHVESEWHLDLTDETNAEVAAAFLSGTGRSRLRVRLAAKALRERLEATGAARLRSYAAEASVKEVGGQVRVGGVGVGASVTESERGTRLVGALTRLADGSWGADAQCRAA